jgi:hypothetical protein
VGADIGVEVMNSSMNSRDTIHKGSPIKGRVKRKKHLPVKKKSGEWG